MKKPNRKPQEAKVEFKINRDIRFPEVRVTSLDGAPVMKTSEAIKLAEDSGEDLILININANPPITTIMDYGKYLYKLKKAEADRKKASAQNEMKEIRLSVNIGEHDLEVKIKSIKKFISENSKVKITMLLKGRQNANPQLGEVVMLKLAQMVEDYAIPEAMPKFESRRWGMILKPKKK